LATFLYNYLAHLRDLTYVFFITSKDRASEEVSETTSALVGSRGLHEKTEKRGKLMGEGRKKTENLPQLVCRFSFKMRSPDKFAPKISLF
jgi:hypothetical protein